MSDFDKNFILKNVFPEVRNILNVNGKTIEEVFKNAVFVLDTNVLLAPYSTGKDDIKRIGGLYESLIKKERLFIPEHAIREFGKHRSDKIGQIFTDLDNYLSSVPNIKPFEYPILEDIDEYDKIKNIRNDILEKIKDYKKDLKSLISIVLNWNWSDPLSKMYSKLFSDKIIITSEETDDLLFKEFDKRIKSNIPPGFKDKGKEYNAIGDFLIWKSILELGIATQKDIILITNDEKNDWLVKGNKKPVMTKFELVEEFFRKTEGNTFMCMNFTEFLSKEGLEVDFKEDYSISTDEFDISILDYIEEQLMEHMLEFDVTDEETYSLDSSLIKAFYNFYKIVDRYKTRNNKADSKIFTLFTEFENMFKKMEKLSNYINYQNVCMKRATNDEATELIGLCENFITRYESYNEAILIYEVRKQY